MDSEKDARIGTEQEQTDVCPGCDGEKLESQVLCADCWRRMLNNNYLNVGARNGSARLV
jgi:hypothetical protein